MARNLTPRGKIVRRLGINIFESPKYDRILEKRPYAPGEHGKGRRTKVSNYGIQLQEKQKVKKMYGILEKQFRRYFREAERAKGVTGTILLQKLERRLDNVVFRSCLAETRNAARQLVRHGHIIVNGRKTDLPSFSVSQNDTIEVRNKESIVKKVKEAVKKLEGRQIPSWLEVKRDKLEVQVKTLPERSDIQIPIKEQLIIELYSK
ncbi:MAG: 30S ribosomal protein S4 [Candidatus Omnitrophica bacterium]|nr:30S ribosomal protein S4 [Candidatus Omnitrophota bacterium]